MNTFMPFLGLCTNGSNARSIFISHCLGDDILSASSNISRSSDTARYSANSEHNILVQLNKHFLN